MWVLRKQLVIYKGKFSYEVLLTGIGLTTKRLRNIESWGFDLFGKPVAHGKADKDCWVSQSKADKQDVPPVPMTLGMEPLRGAVELTGHAAGVSCELTWRQRTWGRGRRPLSSLEASSGKASATDWMCPPSPISMLKPTPNGAVQMKTVNKFKWGHKCGSLGWKD